MPRQQQLMEQRPAHPTLDLNHDGRLDGCSLICEPRWWTDIGGHAGTDNVVKAMIVYDDGAGPALYVGGSFQTAGGVQASGVARWDGMAWSALGSGIAGGEVLALGLYDEGSGPALFVGGSFTSAGGVPANHIARWDGSAWSPVGTGVVVPVAALATYDSGAGPELFTANLDKWNGTAWASVLPPPGFGWGAALIVHNDGSGSALYVAGRQTGGGAVARWDGISCTYISGSGELMNSLALFDDGTGLALYGGGYYTDPVRWNGTSWSAFGGGFGPDPGSYGAIETCSLVTFDDGSGGALYASGRFNSAEGNQVNNIAKWDGSHWSRLETGTNGTVLCMCPFDDGTGPALYVGGSFTGVGQESASHIASWGLPSEVAPAVMCEPGVGSVMPCPCSNPPLAQGLGCNNSAGTGGARLTAIGRSRLANDSLVFTTSGQKPSASCIVLQGGTTIATGVPIGQGVRCIGSPLKRLYLKAAIAGSITAPGAGDLSVSARSAALGSPIAPGVHRYYGVYYRDPIILGGCPAGSGFNITQQLDVLWHP